MKVQSFPLRPATLGRRALSGPSLFVLAGSAAVVSAQAAQAQAQAADMMVDGQRFIPIQDATFDISPTTETAVVASRRGNLVAEKGDYEVFGRQIYVAEELALAQFAPVATAAASASASATLLSGGLSGWAAAPLVAMPVLGTAGATLWHHFTPGVLHFANEDSGLTFENSTAVDYAPSVVNQTEGSSLTFHLTGEGADDERFSIDPQTGELSFKLAPNYENPLDADEDNIYDVEVEARDGEQTAFHAVAVRVQNRDEAPAWVSGPSGTVAENETQTSYVAAGSDEDQGAVLTYRLTGLGPDDDLFAIDEESGVLRLRSAQDFESPGDADGDSAYQVQIAVFDSMNTAVQDVTIRLLDVNEAPVLSAFPSGSSLREGQTETGFSASASDPDAGETVQFYLSPQALDNGFFSIDPATGDLSFLTAPDFDAPLDADGQNDYDVQIYAEDSGLLTDTQTFTFHVLDAA